MCWSRLYSNRRYLPLGYLLWLAAQLACRIVSLLRKVDSSKIVTHVASLAEPPTVQKTLWKVFLASWALAVRASKLMSSRCLPNHGAGCGLVAVALDLCVLVLGL